MVDPDFRSLIELSKESADITKMDPKILRNFMDESSISMQSKRIPVNDVKDVKIHLKDRDIITRVYDNNNSDSAIIYYHGGGFVFGNIETHDNLCRLIARESKMKVISVNYRLAPENKFPAALNDAFDTFHYIHNNKDEFKIKDKICVAGDSAGANLAITLSLKSRDENLPMPDLQVLLYPSLAPDNFSRSFLEYSDGYVLTSKDIMFFGEQYRNEFSDIINPYFSPLVSDNFKNLPSTIIVANEYDPLRDPVESLYKKLRNDNVNAIGIRALGMIHAFATDFEISKTAKNLVKMVSKMIPEML